MEGKNKTLMEAERIALKTSCEIETNKEHIEKVTNYFLRNIDREAWALAKAKATRLNVTMRSVILDLIYTWLDKNHVSIVSQKELF